MVSKESKGVTSTTKDEVSKASVYEQVVGERKHKKIPNKWATVVVVLEVEETLVVVVVEGSILEVGRGLQ